MGMTLSCSVGRVAVLHDVRKEISANIDERLMHQNQIFIDKLKEYNYDIEAFTNAKFQPYLDEYNARQTRPERKKEKAYVEYIKAENEKLLEKAEENKKKGIKNSVRKPTRLVHEYVIQVGDRESNGTTNGADIEKNKDFCRGVLTDIQTSYPHADILLATYHADEPNGTPHMHILVQFTGTGYKQGLSHQISISKALECDGFERSNNRGDYAINRWTEEIRTNIMTKQLKEKFGETRLDLNEHRKHEDTPFFREKAKAEVKALGKLRDDSKAELDFLETEKTRAKEDYRFVVEEKECIQESIANLQVEESRKKRSLEAHRNTLEIIQTDIDAAKSELEDLKGQISALKNEYEELVKQPPEKRYVDVERIVEVPKEVIIEKVVEIPKEVEILKEVEVNYKTMFQKCFSAFQKIVEWVERKFHCMNQMYEELGSEHEDFLQTWKTAYPRSRARVEPLHPDGEEGYGNAGIGTRGGR